MSSDELKSNFKVTGQKQWVNWHESFKPQPLKKLIDVWNIRPEESRVEWYNAATKGFQEVIGEALRQGDSVRAVGGGWSFSDVTRTDGILLNTRPLNYRFRIGATQVHPGYGGDANNLAFVQCGISIADLNRYLRNKGKALKTSGASNGQTIAGAFSAGTHGAALDVGSIQDYVVALHLIISPERTVWLERASQPVMADTFPNILGAELIRDDDLFNAALVSFGCFGIIHGVVIEATDLYYLLAYRRLMPLKDNQGLWKAIENLDFADAALPGPDKQRPYHFQVVINPFDETKGYITVMYKNSAPVAGSKPPTANSKTAPGDNALEIVGAMLQIAPEITPAIVTRLVASLYKEYDGICGTHGEIFTDIAIRGKAASAAMGVPLGQVHHAIDLASRLIKAQRSPCVLSLRYVCCSKATLAFTSHQPHTCVLEIDGPQSQQVMNTFQQIWRAFDDAGIAYTFHWGKTNNLNANRVRLLYGGQRVDAWIAARRKLLTDPKLRHVFANDFLRQMQMHD